MNTKFQGVCARKVYPGWNSSAQNYCGGNWCSYPSKCHESALRSVMSSRDLQQLCAKFDPDCQGIFKSYKIRDE